MAKRTDGNSSSQPNSRVRPIGRNPMHGQPLPSTNAENSLRLLTSDLRTVLLKCFLPNGFHLQLPYDAVSTTEPDYIPTMTALAAFVRTCKLHSAEVQEFRHRDDVYEYRQFASATEYVYKTQRGGAHGQQVADDIQLECVDRYGVDPLTGPLVKIPLHAQVHVFLDLEQDEVLSKLDENIRKQWVAGETHAINISHVWDEDSCKAVVKLLQEKWIGIEELQIGSIQSGLFLDGLSQAIKQCISLKHVSIADGTQEIVSAVCELPNLVSLKLFECKARKIAESLASAKFIGKLECLFLSGRELFAPQEIQSFAKHAASFTALRDIRLWPIDFTIKPESTNSLVESLKASRRLHKICLRCLPENAALAIVKGLKENDQQIKHLEFIELEAQATECGNVLSELIGYKSLQVFVIHSNVDDSGVEHLNAMLSHPSCALQKLELFEVVLQGEEGRKFAEVLRNNRTLHSLTLQGLRMDATAASALASALSDNTTLTQVSLQLDESTSADAAWKIVCGALGSSCLNDFSITSDEWDFKKEEELLALLKTNKSIFRLVLPLQARKPAVRENIELEVYRRRLEKKNEPKSSQDN